MARAYFTRLSLGVGGDTPTWEGTVTVSYTVSWGRPATGPTYSHGGLPADPDEITDLRVIAIDGEPIAKREYGAVEAGTLQDVIENSDALLSQLLEEAVEDDAAALEARSEARAEWGMGQ